MSMYILQKDITDPRWNIKAGSVFKKSFNTPDAAYICDGYNLHPSYVEGNPEWFKPSVRAVGVWIKGSAIPYDRSATFQVNEKDEVECIAMDGKLYCPTEIGTI